MNHCLYDILNLTSLTNVRLFLFLTINETKQITNKCRMINDVTNKHFPDTRYENEVSDYEDIY